MKRIVFAEIKKLTRYELARIVAMRALQLSLGAPPLINIDNLEKKDPYYIAIEEVKRKILPVVIKRRLPNGVEYLFTLRDLEIDISGLDHA
ncbi:MAG: DNA-directed RNA polymerase subunit K [Sulfolobales archaeon]